MARVELRARPCDDGLDVKEIDLHIQQLRLGFRQCSRRGIGRLPQLGADCCRKATMISIRGECHGSMLTTHVPLARILDEPIATTVTSIMMYIDGLRSGKTSRVASSLRCEIVDTSGIAAHLKPGPAYLARERHERGLGVLPMPETWA
jgi:hypothetical protein